LVAAGRDITTISQVEAAYRAAHENGSIDLSLSDDDEFDEMPSDQQDVAFQTANDAGDANDTGDADRVGRIDPSKSASVSDEESVDMQYDINFRIYLLYGGRGNREEDSYATGAMTTELVRQLGMQHVRETFEVEPIGVTASLLPISIEPDSWPTRTFIVLWRDYLRGEESEEHWTGADGAWSVLQQWPCIPSLHSVSAMFSKWPYLDILHQSGCPINQTETIAREDIHRAASSPFQWFTMMCHALQSPKIVVKLPNCSHGRSLVVCTNWNLFYGAIEMAQRKDSPFILVQRFVVFNEVRVFVAGGRVHRAILTLHKENEVELQRGRANRNRLGGTAYNGLYCSVPISAALEQQAIEAFEAVVKGGIAIISARIDIGVVDTRVDIAVDGRLVCFDVGRIVFVS